MDGKISRDEWKGRPEAFDQLDTNKDASLDREELRSAMQRHKNREGSGDAFKRLDTNGDGVLSEEEFKARRRMR
jgi:EF hand.